MAHQVLRGVHCDTRITMSEAFMPWVKIFNEFIHDPKIGKLPATAQLLFVKLIVVAGETDLDGYLISGSDPMTPSDLAWHLHTDEEQLIKDLDALKAAKLITVDEECLLVVNFSKRQGRPQSEKRAMWRERKERSRAKHAESQETRVDNEIVTRETPNVTRDKKIVTGDSLLSSISPLNSSLKSGEVDIKDTKPEPIKASESATDKPARPRDLLFDAIAEVTASNPKLLGSRIAKCANDLKKIDATPDQVHQVARWYAENDWRGRKGEKLTFAALIEVWEPGIKNVKLHVKSNGRITRREQVPVSTEDKRLADQEAARQRIAARKAQGAQP